MNVLLDKEAPAAWILFFEKALESADPLIREGHPVVQGNTITMVVTPSNVGSMREKITNFLTDVRVGYQLERVRGALPPA